MAGWKNVNLPLVWNNTQFRSNEGNQSGTSYASAAKKTLTSKLSFKRWLRINLSPASPLRLVGSQKFMKKDVLNCENVLQIVRMGVGFDHAPRRLPAFTDIESREIVLSWKMHNRNRECAQMQAWLVSGKGDIMVFEHIVSHNSNEWNEAMLKMTDEHHLRGKTSDHILNKCLSWYHWG